MSFIPLIRSNDIRNVTILVSSNIRMQRYEGKLNTSGGDYSHIVIRFLQELTDVQLSIQIGLIANGIYARNMSEEILQRKIVVEQV